MGKKRTVYTPELLKKIVELNALGYPQRHIEKILGLKEDSLSDNKYRNKKRGKTDIVEAFTRGDLAFEKIHLENIADFAIEKDWRASRYLLSIRKPSVFSEKKRLGLEGTDGQPIQMSIVHYGKKEK